MKVLVSPLFLLALPIHVQNHRNKILLLPGKLSKLVRTSGAEQTQQLWQQLPYYGVPKYFQAFFLLQWEMKDNRKDYTDFGMFVKTNDGRN